MPPGSQSMPLPSRATGALSAPAGDHHRGTGLAQETSRDTADHLARTGADDDMGSSHGRERPRRKERGRLSCQLLTKKEHMRGKQSLTPLGCLWPTSYYTCCGVTPAQGRLCKLHLSQVLEHVGEWGCAWPGCQRLSSARRGICGFHVAVAKIDTAHRN
jgi:hypothetical protein